MHVRPFKPERVMVGDGLPHLNELLGAAANHEAARLEALRRYVVLDTAAERAFDGLAEVAAELLGTPIALVTLIDDRRQWFKARVGLNNTETSRDLSFCAHAILRPDEVMVIPDTLLDLRFSANPLVTSGPSIRFYAGAPLLTHDGHALGTLCVASPKARPGGLSAKELRQLQALASLVVDALDLRIRGLALEQKSLLISELNHRIKNTLSIVQSIAEQTRRSCEGAPGKYQRPQGAPEPRQFHADFQARLRALATAHDALTRQTWRGAVLGDLVRELTVPYAGGTAATPLTSESSARVLIAGPSIWLGPTTAVSFALVVHELATNAAKYGALSSPEGRVSVSWGADAATRAVWLRWAETGGPPVPSPPAHSGFGSRLIEATVRRQLGGSLDRAWGSGGLVVDLAVPATSALG